MAMVDKHFDAENKAREINLKEDMTAWKFVLTLQDNDKNFSVSVNKKLNFVIKYENKKIIETSNIIAPTKQSKYDFFCSRISTLCEKIWKKNTITYKITSREEINLYHIKKFASSIISSSKDVQLFFTRPPKQQSINQTTTTRYFIKNLDNKLWGMRKPKDGELNISGQEIIPINKYKKKFATQARSIDYEIKSKFDDKIFYGFMKFMDEQGSLTTKLQSDEAVDWLRAAMDYCQANDDNVYFFLVSDGKEGERNLEKYREQVHYYSQRIYVGNSEEVVKKLKSNE